MSLPPKNISSSLPRIALVTPHYLPSTRGNSVTAVRLENGLRARGCDVRVWQIERSWDLPDMADEIAAYKPSIVHGLHATKFSRLAHRIRHQHGIPVVVTTTGTDVNMDLYTSTRRVTARCLRAASAVVLFAEDTADRVAHELQIDRGKMRVIPQAVDPVEAEVSNVPFVRNKEEFIFCLPAGIRQAKNILFCLPPLHSLRTEYHGIRLILAGPAIEESVAQDLAREASIRPWVEYLGDLPHDQMPHLLRMCDVALNCSLSEGMSSANLEAMALGVPVLASNIEGNRSIIEDGVDGLLFDNESDFMRQATRLIESPTLRQTLAHSARKRIERDHMPETEIESYIEVYRQALASHESPTA